MGALAFLLFVFVWRTQPIPRLARLFACAVFLIVISNPHIKVTKQIPSDAKTLLIVIDKSPSQLSSKRKLITDNALEKVLKKAKTNGLDAQIIRPQSLKNPLLTRTNLWQALKESASTIPKDALSGIVILSDGYLHDSPQNFNDIDVPVDFVLTRDRHDKRPHITIGDFTQNLAPYDIGRISITTSGNKKTTEVSIMQNGEYIKSKIIKNGKPFKLTTSPLLLGENVISICAKDAHRCKNIVINTVKENANILLISAKAYHGARMWRQTLRANPNINLAHVVIMRTPAQAKNDRTPKKQSALIGAPLNDLSQPSALSKFDIIILDAFEKDAINLIPKSALNAIAEYVKNGAGLIIAGDARPFLDTEIVNILPSLSTNNGANTKKSILQKTKIGARHPIMSPIPNDMRAPWIGSFAITPKPNARVLLENDATPLLLIFKVGDGRVVQINSKTSWIWGSGYQGALVWSELLNNIISWLLGSPSMEEGALRLKVQENEILISAAEEGKVLVTSPDSSKETIYIGKNAYYAYKPKTAGLYTFKTASRLPQIAIIGAINPPEWDENAKDLTPPRKWADFIKSTSGQITYADDISKISALSSFSSTKSAYETFPLISPIIAIASLIASMIGLWFIEKTTRRP